MLRREDGITEADRKSSVYMKYLHVQFKVYVRARVTLNQLIWAECRADQDLDVPFSFSTVLFETSPFIFLKGNLTEEKATVEYKMIAYRY